MKDVATFDFDDLIDGEFDFYGICGRRFRLDDVTYEVIEHENGLCSVVISDEHIDGLPIARVIVEHPAFADDCYEINDLHDDHCWLEFGSVAYINEYDFIFDYAPKGTACRD